MSIVLVSAGQRTAVAKKETPAKKDIDKRSWFEYIAKSVAGTWSLKTK